jgi:hypothetical protein
MNRRHRGFLVGLTCGAVLALTVPARAAFINGSLDTTSGFTETATSLLFCLSSAIPCPNTTTGTFDLGNTGTGDFAAPYANDPSGVTVTNLNSTIAPVGTVLPGNGIVFLIFNPSVSLPTPDIKLWISEVLPGVGGTADCGLAPAGAQTCTPPGSAVTFLNTAGGDSSATITANGEAERISTGQFDPLQIIFTAQFNTPYQTVLADFAATGSISSTESGSFTATATPTVPEPMTSALLGSGLLALGIMLRLKRG